MKSNIYTQNGYTNRNDYLHGLADEHQVDFASVQALAELLGEDEDFDGLISELEDFSQFI